MILLPFLTSDTEKSGRRTTKHSSSWRKAGHWRSAGRRSQTVNLLCSSCPSLQTNLVSVWLLLTTNSCTRSCRLRGHGTEIVQPTWMPCLKKRVWQALLELTRTLRFSSMARMYTARSAAHNYTLSRSRLPVRVHAYYP